MYSMTVFVLFVLWSFGLYELGKCHACKDLGIKLDEMLEAYKKAVEANKKA